MNSLSIETPSLKEETLPETLSDLELRCMDYRWEPSQWKDFFNSHEGKSKLFLVTLGDERIGLLFFHLNSWSGQAHLLKIGLRPDTRGSGAASALLKEGIKWLKENGYKEIFLEVGVLNKRAVGFYRKSGFVQLCVKKQFYSDGADAFAMLLSL